MTRTYLSWMEALRYRDIREKKDRVLRLTGFQPEEFEALCAKFTPVWEKYIKNSTLEGKPRKRQVKKERKNSMLPTTEDKLLFLLYEHKNYHARGLGYPVWDGATSCEYVAENPEPIVSRNPPSGRRFATTCFKTPIQGH